MISKYYKHFNSNPKGIEGPDCVIRALSALTNKSWYEVFDIICAHARQNGVMPNDGSKANVEARMKLFGLKRCKVAKPKKGSTCYSVQQFCKDHPKGRYILIAAHHEVAVIDGYYYDLYPVWDSARVYSYYELT